MRKFRHEHLAKKPRGYRVRTVQSGRHELRVAYPRGPRQRGSGRLLEILHPKHENPICKVRNVLPNPGELVLMGANPHRRPNPSRMGRLISTLKKQGASSKEVGRALTRATNPKPEYGYIVEWRAPDGKTVDRSYFFRSRRLAEEARNSTRPANWESRVLRVRSDDPRIGRDEPRPGTRNPRRELTVPEKHQLRIAKDTLRMSDAGARIMGGMTKEEARAFLRKHGIRFKENPRRNQGHFTVVAISEEIFEDYIRPRLRRGYAKTFAEYRRKHPGMYAVFDSRGRFLKVGTRKEVDAFLRPYVPNPRGTLPGHVHIISMGDVPGKKVRLKNPRWVRTPHGTVGRMLERQGRRSPRYRIFIPGRGAQWVRGPVYEIDPLHYLPESEVRRIEAIRNPLLESAVGGAAAGTMAGIAGGLIASGAVKRGVRALRGNPRRSRERMRQIEAELYVIGGKLAGPWKLTAAERARLEQRDKELRRELQPYLDATHRAMRGNPRKPGKTGKAWLTPEEEYEWEKMFETALGDGLTPSKADREAARWVRQKFPRLRAYSGFQARSARRNPAGTEAAAQLYRDFHGRDPKEILELEEPEQHGRTLTSLGDLVELRVSRNSSGFADIDFRGDGVKLASNPEGTQIYFVGGNQDLNGTLGRLGVQAGKESVNLGAAVSIVYRARKSFTDFKATDWEHAFGEEGGERPQAIYDAARKRLVLAGGSYRVEKPGIVN